MSTMMRNEFYEKYGDVRVTFSSYYKYTFTFTGTTPEGKSLSVECGGDSDEIYQFEVSADDPARVKDLYPYAGVCGEDNFYDF
jgi:hypothetical protein